MQIFACRLDLASIEDLQDHIDEVEQFPFRPDNHTWNEANDGLEARTASTMAQDPLQSTEEKSLRDNVYRYKSLGPMCAM